MTGGVTIAIQPHDTLGFTGGSPAFAGEKWHFVFDALATMNDSADDRIGAGVIVTATNGATLRLVPSPGNPPVPTSAVPNKYATFFSRPYGNVNGNNRFNSPFTSGGIAGRLTGSGTYQYTDTAINAAWYDTNASSHDGPAAVFRVVIDVTAVVGANTSGGLGSIYFTTGSPGSGDIKVADMTFDVEHKYADSGPSTVTGSFYVTD